MKDDSPVFGAKPDNLDRLLRFALEPLEAENESPPTASLDSLTEKPGGRIDHYRLLQVLGEGGMGIVYLAQQEEPVRRQVALKVIKPGMDSKRIIARFEAEKQALALMQHPHIAGVYDAGLTLTGRPYFAMEYVQGLPITEHCDGYKLTIEQRLRLFQKVCQAVQHAHQKGIIHRDIKPSNVLVSLQDDEEIPKIIDFGVAKAIAQPLTEQTLTTAQGQLFGTPEYMSPEQADMATEDIDTRSDIYSLGVLLYALLTGVLPFEPETLREGGIDRIRKTIRDTDPQTPSTRLAGLGEEAKKCAENRRMEVQTLAKHLRKELEWIPLKAMRKERSERYRSAAELADDIDNYLNGAPVIAGPSGTVYRLKKFMRRNAALSSAVLTAVVTLIVGLITTTVMYMQADHARAEAEAVSDFLRNDVLASMNPRETVSSFAAKDREVTVRSFLDTASERLEGRFSDKPLVEASIRQTLGTTYTGLGLYAQSESHLDRALRIYRGQLGAADPATLLCSRALGLTYFWQGRYDEAEILLTEATKGLESALGEEHPDTLLSMSLLGWVYNAWGPLDQAQRLFVRGLEISRRVFGEEDPNTGGFEYGLGFTLHRLADYAEAERLYKQSLMFLRRVRGEEDMQTLEMMNFLGELYQELGRYDEAERLHERVLQVRDRILGPQHPDTLRAKTELARLRIKQGRYEEAELLLDGTVKPSDVTRYDDDVSASIYMMFTLAELYFLQGQYDEAEQHIVPVLETRRAVFGEEHWRTLSAISMLAKLYTAQGRYDEADQYLVQALDTGRLVLGEEHPLTLDALNALAVLRSRQEKYNEAENWLLEAYVGRADKLGPEHPMTLKSLNNLIELYQVWGKSAEANQWRAKLPQTEAVEQ